MRSRRAAASSSVNAVTKSSVAAFISSTIGCSVRMSCADPAACRLAQPLDQRLLELHDPRGRVRRGPSRVGERLTEPRTAAWSASAWRNGARARSSRSLGRGQLPVGDAARVHAPDCATSAPATSTPSARTATRASSHRRPWRSRRGVVAHGVVPRARLPAASCAAAERGLGLGQGVVEPLHRRRGPSPASSSFAAALRPVLASRTARSSTSFVSVGLRDHLVAGFDDRRHGLRHPLRLVDRRVDVAFRCRSACFQGASLAADCRGAARGRRRRCPNAVQPDDQKRDPTAAATTLSATTSRAGRALTGVLVLRCSLRTPPVRRSSIRPGSQVAPTIRTSHGARARCDTVATASDLRK